MLGRIVNIQENTWILQIANVEFNLCAPLFQINYLGSRSCTWMTKWQFWWLLTPVKLWLDGMLYQHYQLVETERCGCLKQRFPINSTWSVSLLFSWPQPSWCLIVLTSQWVYWFLEWICSFYSVQHYFFPLQRNFMQITWMNIHCRAWSLNCQST